MNDVTKVIGLIVLIAIIVAVIIFVPFLQIYAVNQLFKTEIEYSWFNWFLVLFLGASIRSVNYQDKLKSMHE